MTTLLLLATISIWRMGGDINITDAPNGASLHTMGGDITFDHAASVDASTMGGKINIGQASGAIKASTMAR